MNAVDITTGADAYNGEASWAPTTPYHAGSAGAPATAMTEYQRALVVAKVDGLYGAVDETYVFPKLMDFSSFIHYENGRGMIPFGYDLYIPTSQDLLRFPAQGRAAVGLTSLVTNLSAVTGRPTATTKWGEWLFCAFYDGTDSYICRARLREHEQVPQELLWWAVTKVPSYKVTALEAFSDMRSSGEPVTYLAASCPSATSNKHDVMTCILAPASARQSAASGVLLGTRMGDPVRKTIVERVSTYGVSLSGANFYTLAISWDDGAFNTLGSFITDGAQRVTLTPGTNDSGTVYQARLTSTVTTPSTRPRLRALAATETGNGGLLVEGQRQLIGQVDAFEMTIDAAEEVTAPDGSRFIDSPVELREYLNGLTDDGPVEMTNQLYKNGAFKVLVYSVDAVELEMPRPDHLPRVGIKVTGRLLKGS